jgi:type IX secretion system substrate protein/NHL repeat-containing protein
MKKLITILTLAFCYNINAQIITTVAGDSTGGYNTDGGLAISEQLNNPYGVAADQFRNLYIADMNNSRIRMVTTSTGVMTTIAGNGTFGYAGDGSAATAAQLSSPYGIAVDAARNVYIADYDNYVVRKVTVGTGIISTIVGNGTAGHGGDGGSAVSAQLGGAMGVSIDASGNLYIADYNNNCIRMVTASTGNISTVAGNYTAGAGYTGDGGAAISAQLFHPTGVTVDASGNIYIADYGNGVVRKVNLSGIISTIAGNGTQGYTGDGGQATAAQLSHPWNITSGSGNLYIADYSNQVIRKVNSSGIISTIAGNGTQGYTGDCGNPISAELSYPAGIALDSYGNLYIADNVNNRIRKLLFTASQTNITAHATQTVVCSGNAITFTGSGANTYTWTGGVTNGLPYTEPSVIDTTITAYYLTGTDSNQCVSINTASVVVRTYPLPTITGVASTTICVGQSVTLTASLTTTMVYTNHVQTYAWTGGVINGVPFMPSTTSNYIVTGTSYNWNGSVGCSSSVPITVTVVNTPNPLPVVTISSTPITTCGGTATLTANGATTYTWSTGQNGVDIVVTPTISTTYTVIGTNLGCSATGTVTQVVNAVNITSNIDSLCNGGSATLTANGATTYTWSTSPSQTGTSIVVTPAVTTTYTVTGTNALNCTSGYAFTQIVRAPLVMHITSSIDSLCVGATATLTASGATTYTWNTGSNSTSVVVTPTISTTYTVTGTNTLNCSSHYTFKQIVRAPLVMNITSSIDSLCVGATATLTASGASTYTWNPGNQNGATISVTPTVTTTYSVIGTATTTCTDSKTYTQNVHPVITISSTPITTCGSSATLTATGATTYTWNTGQNGAIIVVTPTTSTTYSVSGSGNGCTTSNNVTQFVNVVNITSTIDTLCSGGSAILTANNTNTLTANESITYTWSTTATTSTINVNPTVYTTYTVTGTLTDTTVSDTTQCISSQTFTQIVRAINISTSADSVCIGGAATLTAIGADTYSWSTSQNGATISVTPTVTTTYTVTGIAQTCTVTNTIQQLVDLGCVEGIKQLSNSNNEVTIYPNPAINGLFNISINENAENSNIVVLNSLGQKVFETKITGQNTQIYLPNCLPGIYYAQVSNGAGGTSVKKVIVN